MVDDLSNSYGGQNSTALAVLAFIDMDGLSYEEYFKKVEEMIENLRQYWKSEQRVKALKVAIQLTKLLADTNQIRLYSKKYKMITDVLDEFGRLVYNRIQSRASGKEDYQSHQQASSNYNYLNSTYSLSNSNVDSTSIVENIDKAKDTCRNWFLKIASIRELVPRFYTELAVLKVCDVLLKNQSNKIIGLTVEQFYCQSIKRLSKAAWGFGDPIIAIHARAYICKVAQRLISWRSCDENELLIFDIIMMNLEAGAKLVNQLNLCTLQKLFHHQKLESMIYFDLISGQLQYILNLVTLRDDVYDDNDILSESNRVKFETLFDCLMKYAKQDGTTEYSRCLLLNSALKALPNDIIACHAQEILDSIEEAHKTWTHSNSTLNLDYSKMIVPALYATLGSYVLALDGSDEFESKTSTELKENLLNSLLDILETLFIYETNNNPQISSSYLRSFEICLSYANHYSKNQTNVHDLLSKFVLRIKEDRQYVQHHSVILNIIKILITNKKNLTEIKQVSVMKSFQQIMGLLSKDDHKLEASRWILETLRANLKINKQEPFTISDRTLTNFILRLSIAINDSLSPLTPYDDVEHLSQLIIYYLDKIAIQDYKEHLDLLSRCRGTLGNLNPVLEYLSMRVLDLALEYSKVEKKRGAKRNYLNGCLAFTFITIPAISKPMVRLNLFNRGAQLALSQSSLSLADYFIKQALMILDYQMTPEKVKVSGAVTSIDEETPCKLEVMKPLLDEVRAFMDLMLNYEDYIDLRHKLSFAILIRSTNLNEHSTLVSDLARLNIHDEDYTVDTS